MHHPIRRLAALVLVGTLAVAACGDDDDDAGTETTAATAASDPSAASETTAATSAATAPASSAPSEAEAFPVTIPTTFGDVTVESEPTTIVALGWGDAETALALGVQPVAASDWMAFGGEGVGPWAAGLYDTPPELVGTLEINYEAIAALQPDLILNTRSDGSQETYDTLAAIAPTVGPPADVAPYTTTWRQQMEMVSAAVGRPELGADLIAEVDAAFEAASDPVFEDKTVTVGALYDEGYGAYVRGDSRVDFMEALGFVNRPEIQELATDTFFVEVADERLDLFDAELAVLFPIGAPAAEQLATDPLLQATQVAQDGHLVIIDDLDTAAAFSSGTTLGQLYAIEHAVPLFTAALS